MGNPVDHASLRSPAAERLRGSHLVALHFLAPLARPCHLRFGRADWGLSLPATLQEQAAEQIKKAQAQIGAQIVAKTELPLQLQIIPQQAKRLGMFEPFDGNAFEFLRDYEGSINRLIQDIDSAGKQLHLLTYIYRTDRIGRRMTDAIKRAAQRGVVCRLLLDAVGSRVALKQFGPELREAGAEVRSMLPVGLFRRKGERFDLRNHRKIPVIDGTIGYVGSQNIADPNFVKKYPNEELVARVTGPVVSQLQATFLGDHYLETEQVFDLEELFPDLKPTGNSAAQLLPRRTRLWSGKWPGVDYLDVV